MESPPHRIDPVVCLSTAAIYLLCCFVLSPLLVTSSSTAQKYLRAGKRQHQLLGQLIHSVLTSYFTMQIIMSGSMVEKAKSTLGFLTVEIAFSYLVTELVVNVVVFQNTMIGARMEFMHHMASTLGLLIGIYNQGTTLVLCILRLLSQLSNIFLTIKLWLLLKGMKETNVFLANYTLKVVTFFMSRIVTLPWYWTLYVYWVLARESSLLLCVVVGLVSGFFDILSIYWFYWMIVKLVENVKAMGKKKF